jgi:hypothetical protein
MSFEFNNKIYNTEFLITKDHHAANAYYINEDNTRIQLTLDWTFDSIYFKYKDNWIILSTGEKGHINEIDKLNTLDIIQMFKKISFNVLNEFKPFSHQSTECINGLKNIINMIK